MDYLTIRELELIRDATEHLGKARNGTAISQELKTLHDKVVLKHKTLTNAIILNGV